MEVVMEKMMKNKLCSDINEALNVSESAKGLKAKFPELFKVIIKDGGADIARDAEMVTKVDTKGGDVYIVTTAGHANYFSLKYGWIGEEDEGLDHKNFEKHQAEFDKNKKKGEKTKITEAQHYNTKVRGLDASMGSRRIRMGVKESLKAVKKMLDENNSSPNPLTNKDRKLLTECSTLFEQAIPRLKEVKETRRKGKK
jgi:hypothetical protein